MKKGLLTHKHFSVMDVMGCEVRGCSMCES